MKKDGRKASGHPEKDSDFLFVGFYIKPDPGNPFATNFYYPIYDQYGNVHTYDIHPNPSVANLTYTYE